MDIVRERLPQEDVKRQESRSGKWHVCGRDVPISEIVTFSQVIITYIVMCLCLFNLTTNRGDSNLWSALLSSCLRYSLHNPTIKQ